MPELIRTFICLDIPTTIKQRLTQLTNTLQASATGRIAWVKPDSMHLTLRFLGDVALTDQAMVATCTEAAAQGVAPFSLKVAGAGIFPNSANARTFWVGITNAPEQLLPLQKKLNEKLLAAGFGREDHPFSPHITIGRAKQGSMPETAKQLLQLGFSEEVLPVSEIIIMRSDLLPKGPQYTRLATIKLLA